MNIQEYAETIHNNAVQHGWWEDERSMGEIVALCHSELSEALEAYRNGEEPVWDNKGKPDGIAVELIDCVIRILDVLGHYDIDIVRLMKREGVKSNTIPEISKELHSKCQELHFYDNLAFGDFLSICHNILSEGFLQVFDTQATRYHFANMIRCMVLIFGYLDYKRIDSELTLVMKHRYNVSRPYKHGGKRI